ncbi:MAG: Crp/Fnr family transcriptional regulator [Muribaculaceae bacterium]|nr:Crp/Fnr family transcriptional regulator [Muribaculaceae bacterium]
MVTRREIPNILSWITGRRQISDTSVDTLLAHLEPCRFPKKHLLVKEGEARGMAYFIEKGMTRSYWLVDGQEITTSFTTDGCIVFSMDELYYGRISEEYVETVEPVEAFAITLADLRRLVTTDIDFAIWWSLIHQDEYRRLHRSHKERLTLPAAERYRAFAQQQPEACRRARLTDIASYLGITPSTLSRIRASIFLSQDK